jgi:2,3-bisphosphoglycerate-dependent phosphoglycerate mutase
MRTRLLFIRHGQTAWNKEKKLQGHTDITLDETGIIQAREVAAYCRQFAGELSALYSSDLQRALQTAQEISKTVLKTVQTHAGLREGFGGKAEGLTREEREKLYGKSFFNYPEAEQKVQILERVKNCINEIDKKHRGSTVIMVTHAGVLRTLLEYASHPDASAVSLHNCCVVEFHVAGTETRQITFVNLHAHQ